MFHSISDIFEYYKLESGVKNMEILLFLHKVKDEEKVFDEWTLPATDRFPARDMIGFNFYDLEKGRMDRMNISAEEFNNIKIHIDGEESGIENLRALVSHPEDQKLIVVKVGTEDTRKGRITIAEVKTLTFMAELTVKA